MGKGRELVIEGSLSLESLDTRVHYDCCIAILTLSTSQLYSAAILTAPQTPVLRARRHSSNGNDVGYGIEVGLVREERSCSTPSGLFAGLGGLGFHVTALGEEDAGWLLVLVGDAVEIAWGTIWN